MKIICVSEYWQLLTLNATMLHEWNILQLRIGNKFIHLINVNSHLKAEAGTQNRGRGEEPRTAAEPASSVNYAQSHGNAEISRCLYFTIEWINQPSHTHTHTCIHNEKNARCITLRRANVSAAPVVPLFVCVSTALSFLRFALPHDFNAKLIL